MFTWIEINSKAVEHNILQFKKNIGKKKELMPVIKSNAYGHGFLNIAKICEKNKNIKKVAVVNSDEATRLLNNNFKKKIMILSFFEFDEALLLKLSKKNVIFPLYTEKQAKILNKVGENLGKKIKTHLKIDTGTTRLGVLLNNLDSFLAKIEKYKNIEIEGLWSHFASSESNKKQTKEQFELFKEAAKKLENNNIKIKYKHMSCTSASILFSIEFFDIIRLGLGLYGLYPDNKSKNKIKLKPALSWYTKIIQVKEIEKNVKIGYGGTYISTKKMKIATLPIGYSDGYDRRLSNNSYVIIKNQKCRILGRICMNLTMVDVTKLRNVKEGDLVLLLGKNKKNVIRADDLANFCKTINYEIVDRINPLIPRIIK